MTEWCREHETKGKKGVLIQLYVQPGARKTAIKGVYLGDTPRLKLSIQAPPVDGAANQAVIDWLCETLNISQSKILILSGEKSRLKNLWVEGISRDLVLKSLS